MMTKDVYEYTFKQLLKHVKDSRDSMCKSYNQFKESIMPVVNLGDEDYELYQNIVESNAFAVKSAIVQIIKHLMECFAEEDEAFSIKYAARQFYIHQTYDMMLLKEKKKIAYYFKLGQFLEKEVTDFEGRGFDELVIVHMRHYDSNSYKVCIADTNSLNREAGKSMKHITLQEFFCEIFGPEEYDCFVEYVNRFNETAQLIIGFNTVLAPTEDNIEKFRELTIKEIHDFKYEEYVQTGIDPKQIGKIRGNYIGRGLYKIMLGESTFAISFLSSEWSYKIYKATDNLEQTGIIAGYLKSIEQLVFELAKLRAGERNITINKKGWSESKYFTKKVSENINFSLGELEYFLVDNVNLFGVEDDVRDYIVATIKDWRENQRNGYFHKHNLKKVNRVDEIRKKAIFLYFLLLGGYKIRNSDIGKLKIYTEKKEKEKTDEQILEELTDWINEILAYGILGKNEAIVFNLYDEKDYGWSLQLTTVETCEELANNHNIKESFTSGKDLYKWKSILDEKAAQMYISDLIGKYLESNNVYEGIEKLKKIAVWCRYGIMFIKDK